MTWNELKAHIEVMDEEQRNASVMIYNIEIDEYFAIRSMLPELDGSDEKEPAALTEELSSENHPLSLEETKLLLKKNRLMVGDSDASPDGELLR